MKYCPFRIFCLLIETNQNIKHQRENGERNVKAARGINIVRYSTRGRRVPAGPSAPASGRGVEEGTSSTNSDKSFSVQPDTGQ
jgi:hypothetical protein